MEFINPLSTIKPWNTVVKDLRSLEKEIGDFKSSQTQGASLKLKRQLLKLQYRDLGCEWFKMIILFWTH
jgi:hypothetical protein